MATSTNLKVKKVDIPKHEEKALFDAYRRDIVEMGEFALSSNLNLTINIYKPSYTLKGLSPNPGEKLPLDSLERFILSNSRKQSLGNGVQVVDLLYNKVTKRYEVLRQEKGRFVLEGNAGDKENSLYHCMVQVKEPSLVGGNVANKAAFYKREVTSIQNDSDSNVREMLERNVIPGSNVENELQRISLDRKKYVAKLKSLVRELRDELDTVEPPQRDRSKYAVKFQVTRHLLETLEYDYERRARDFTYDELVEEHKRIQQSRLRILKEGYKNAHDWLEKDVYVQELIKGNEDYKAVALVAVMDDESLNVNEKFRLTSTLTTSIDPEKLKREYMSIRGKADMKTLETDMKAKFYVEGEPTSPLRLLGGITKYFSVGEGHKLQFPYLKSLLETGKQSSSAQLAMKLGLLYRGAQVTKITPKQKDEIKKLVEENPGELAALADVDDSGNMRDTEDEFLQAAYAKLKTHHSGILGEMKTRLKHSVTTRPITGIDVTPDMTITDGAAKSLFAMLYDAKNRQLRTVGPSPTDTTEVRKKILDWIKGCREEELKKFIQAADSKRVLKSPNAYEVVWSLIDRHMERALHKGSWKEYFQGMAEAQVQHEPQEMRPFYEVEAFLKYKKSRGGFLSYKEQKETLDKVLNMLSASDGWDPKAKLTALVANHTGLKKRENYDEYKKDPTLWLDELLNEAGVDPEGREQVNLLLYAGGTYNGDEATDSGRNIDNYLSLKRKASRKHLNKLLHGLSMENILTTIGKVKPGSLEHWLMRKDKKLLKEIREELRDQFTKMRERRPPHTELEHFQNKLNTMWSGICETLDLKDKWNNLDLGRAAENSLPPEEGDGILPEPPSKDDLKAFKEGYKDEELKKKLWAGKYVLSYSLAKDQSLFNMSDRKELLKIVYEGQLEDYKGDELMEILDNIDPKIRDSLMRTPPASWTKHEKAAHAQLNKFLFDGEEIAFKDFLSVAKGILNNDYSVIDFAVNDLSPNKSAPLWFSKSYKELKTWSETRLQKTLRLHGIDARTTSEPSAEAQQLEAEIADLDEKIRQHEFKLDDELKSQLEGLTLDGKTAEFERKLKQKIGEKMLSEPESFKDLHIPPFELARKGTKVLSEADIKYQQYLRTGKGYHRFSVSGLESYAAGNNFMRNLWKIACAQPIGTALEREKEEQALLKSLKTAHDDLLSSLDTWKDKQDEYTKRVVNTVNLAVGAILYTIIAATGVGTVGFVSLGVVKSTLTTITTKVVEKILSRRHDVLTREIVKEAMVTAVAAVPGVLATVDYGDVPGLKNIINNTIGGFLVKGQINAISKAVVGAIGNVFVATGAGSFEMETKAFKEDVVKKLQDYNLTLPEIYKTVLSSISYYTAKDISDLIQTGITDMNEEDFKNLDPAEKAELTAKFKPLQVLFKNIYNTAMTNKIYDVRDFLSKGAVTLANLPFADNTEVDKNELEEERDDLAIAISLVDALAEKGLRVDSDFDYGDAEKLMEQIADNMPGTKLTQDEIRTLTAEVDSNFVEKQERLTNDEKELSEAEQRTLLLDRAKEERLEVKRAPWKEELAAMKTRFKTECDEVKVKAEKKAEEEIKKAHADIQEGLNGDKITEALRGNENLVTSAEKASPGDDDSYVVAQAIATRLYGKKSKKSKEAVRKKIEAQWRRHREKKKGDAALKATALKKA